MPEFLSQKKIGFKFCRHVQLGSFYRTVFHGKSLARGSHRSGMLVDAKTLFSLILQKKKNLTAQVTEDHNMLSDSDSSESDDPVQLLEQR